MRWAAGCSAARTVRCTAEHCPAILAASPAAHLRLLGSDLLGPRLHRGTIIQRGALVHLAVCARARILQDVHVGEMQAWVCWGSKRGDGPDEQGIPAALAARREWCCWARCTPGLSNPARQQHSQALTIGSPPSPPSHPPCWRRRWAHAPQAQRCSQVHPAAARRPACAAAACAASS